MTALFLAFVVVSVLIGKVPIAVLWLYLGASVVAFLAYAFDKSAAKNDRWRVRETTLHFLALIGGWPGGLAAQRLLRHKSKKPSFQVVFWATVTLNSVAFVWLYASHALAFG